MGELGRSDLFLPLYYISAPQMDDPEVRGSDELARVLASRQLADWRELRFKPFTSPVVRKAVAQLASRMRDLIMQPSGDPEPAPARPSGKPDQPAAVAEKTAASPTARIAAAPAITAESEQPVHVVDSARRRDFATVGEAIKAAKPGDRILVRPGLYLEALVVDKQLEILGDGPAAEIVISARDAHTLQFRASTGRVANLTLLQADDEGDERDESWYGVTVDEGQLDLEGCDISSRSGTCVWVSWGAELRLRRSIIRDGNGAGVAVTGLATLEDNDITGNTTGVWIVSSNCALRGNQIRGNTVGVMASGGLSTLEDNNITDNAHRGVLIQFGNGALRGNRIRGSRYGVCAGKDALGTLEDNEITDNTEDGVWVEHGNLTLRRNRINRNGSVAIRIGADAGGRAEDNDLSGNRGGAWSVPESRKANVTRARNKE